MTRPLGTKIIDACAFIGERGQAFAHELSPVLEMQTTNVCKILTRAVRHGLMTIDRSTRPQTFRVVPDWRERAARIGGERKLATPPVLRATQPARKDHHLQTIWRNL